jgi:hypothetical protein
MIAIVDELSETVRNAAASPGRVVPVTTNVTGSTLSKVIVEVIASSSYVYPETEGNEKPNVFTTKYQRQREWWNTPKKQRRRKK